jgi:hypothetical protein
MMMSDMLNFSWEHKGFSAFGIGYTGYGLGFDFAVGREHVYVHFRILNRAVDVQWEAGF